MNESEFDPLHFLRLADGLATDDADEAALRTAIGRAYYAVFLLARARTGVQGKWQAHERVRQAISPVNDRLAAILGTIATVRYFADYELHITNANFSDWKRNWQQVRQNVTRVLEELESLPDLTISENIDR
ncbi:MAG TPA: hypothetical protein VFV93_04425 [Thermomicrobiales bacterium]|nr:hypothetical protein [Thermomicrobiales bacterium]